jgi:hypothetical protein
MLGLGLLPFARAMAVVGISTLVLLPLAATIGLGPRLASLVQPLILMLASLQANLPGELDPQLRFVSLQPGAGRISSGRSWRRRLRRGWARSVSIVHGWPPPCQRAPGATKQGRLHL